MNKPRALYRLYSSHFNGDIVSVRALKAIQRSMVALDFDMHIIQTILSPDLSTTAYLDYDEHLEVFVHVAPTESLEVVLH